MSVKQSHISTSFTRQTGETHFAPLQAFMRMNWSVDTKSETSEPPERSPYDENAYSKGCILSIFQQTFRPKNKMIQEMSSC